MAIFSKERYRELLLKTMKSFIALCEKNDIQYVAAFGTVLGAIRHKGLIPWDDDIDVFMTRENYERFLKLKDKMSGTGYEIVDKSNKGYYLPYAKFCDSQTTIWEVKRFPFTLGLFIDVFPLDKASDNQQENEAFANRYSCLFGKYVHGFRRFEMAELFHLRGIKSLVKSVVYSKMVSLASVEKMEDEIKTVRGDCCMYYRGTDRPERCVFPAKMFEDCIDVPFEDFTIRIPREYDAYLNACYGDYMQPPPENERISQHYQYFVDLDRRLSVEEIRRIKNGK